MDIAVNVDDSSPRPLHLQLYDELRLSILSGRLCAGQRIPSTRALAANLGVSRSTVTLCYEQLIAEGYLQTAVGSGTSVSALLPEDLLQAQPVKTEERSHRAHRKESAEARTPRLSSYGSALLEPEREPRLTPAINFRMCRPLTNRFPSDLWRRLLLRQHRTAAADMLDYAKDGFGYEPLRAAIAAYLGRSRAVRCDKDQIVIVNGSQQALHLIAQVLVDRGDVVAMEDPGYHGARQAFLAQGARLRSVPVDDGGMRVDLLPSMTARLVYVTPSHQFPSGAALTLQRRLELLAWADSRSALVVEDDYDSEFRYGSRPIPALQGLDRSDCVLYVGTFSKVLFPSLRLGYLVAPKNLARIFERAKWLADRHSPMLEQRVLTDFINEGHFDRHLRRMRTLYGLRRQAMTRALKTHFGDRVKVLGENSGMHLMIRLETRFGNDEVVKRAEAAGVGVINGSNYYQSGSGEGEFVMGYACLGERRIVEGIKRFAAAVCD